MYSFSIRQFGNAIVENKHPLLYSFSLGQIVGRHFISLENIQGPRPLFGVDSVPMALYCLGAVI